MFSAIGNGAATSYFTTTSGEAEARERGDGRGKKKGPGSRQGP